MYNVILFSDLTDSIIAGLTLGPTKCAHVLREAGFSCLVIQHLSSWSESELKELLDLVIGSETVLVGFSTTFLQQGIYDEHGLLKDTKKTSPHLLFPQGTDFENNIISHIRSINHDVKIAIGGARATAENTNPNVNYVVLGYSEKSIINLVDHLANQSPLLKSYRSLWNKIVIDDKTAAEYHFPSGTMKWLPEDVVNHRLLPLEVARGCIFRCKFCSYPMNGKQQLDFVRYPQLLAEEMSANYHQYGINHYLIVDDTFNDHREKLEAFRDAIKTLDFQPVFWAYHRLDLLCTRPDTLPILHDIGVRAMFFGIETLYQPTGRLIGKGYNPSRMAKMVRHIKTTYPDISLHGSFIIGLPGEPVDSVLNTYQLIRSRELPLDSWIFHALRIHRSGGLTFDSEINQDPAAFGYQDQGSLDEHPGLINWCNEHLDFETALQLHDKFTSESRESDDLKLTGQVAIQLFDMGMDFDIARNTPWHAVEWHDLRTRLKADFLQNYREALKNIIRNKISHFSLEHAV